MSPDQRLLYNEEMRKALDAKLFFMPHVNQHTSRYVDFGCGDGSVLAECSKRSLYRYPNLFGIDAAPQFHVADTLCHIIVGGPDALAKGFLRDKPEETTLILSSVLHEMVSQHGRLDVLPVSSLRPRFIAIRDMSFPANAEHHLLGVCDMVKLRALGSEHQWQTFQNNWGKVDNWRAAAHWALKAPYADNWEHEVKEDYLCLDRMALTEWLLWLGYTVIHRRVFTPAPVVARLTAQGIGLPWHTHIELVAERCTPPS